MKFSALLRYVDRPWYTYFVGFLTFINNFVFLLPSDGFLVSAVLVRPRSWLRAAVVASTGSALGGLALAALLEWNPEYVMRELLPSLYQSQAWSQIEPYVNRYGAWAVGAVAALPFPQVPAVVVAALAGVPLHEIFLGCWLGRLVKWILLAWLASHTPSVVARFTR